ncbi:uncharacterized protein LOC109710721 [Ananas comosus]|uniref:Uncharacterized protein LOC109710721 n=1 Tax=Ananas comosus TaxID=4615 RepID=A0A6P5F6C7_ANACO|nr:uncharacterized protein LOC109710721 [Ananas comosus]
MAFSRLGHGFDWRNPAEFSSAGHKFLIVAVDYFTKWVEVKPARLVTQKEIIDFVEDHIIHRFRIFETITIDQGTMFTGGQFVRFIESRKIRLLHSSPYYAQVNGQAEAANKVIINLMKRHIGKYPRKWNEKLSEVLWACRTSVKMATGMTPFQLVYGHEAVVPAEITVPSLRLENQRKLSADEYSELMKDEMDKLHETRLTALNHLQAYQNRFQQLFFSVSSRDALCKAEKVLPSVLYLLLFWTSSDLVIEVDAQKYELQSI